MKRIAVYSIVTLPVVFAVATYALLASLSIQSLIICAVEPDAYKIPTSLCRLYLDKVTNTADARELDEGPGLTFVMGIENKEDQLAILDRMLTLGTDINGVSKVHGLTPIHAAILRNDPELVQFLIARGARLNVPEKSRGLNARQYLQLMKERNPDLDQTEVARLLQ